MTASKIILYLCLAYVAGVFVFTSPRFREDKKLDLFVPTSDVGTISFVSIVAKEPDIREKIVKLKVQNILITTGKYPEYKYGDKLKITGILKEPSEDINGFNYKDYLKKDGIYYVMSFPKIELTGEGFGSPVMKFLFSFKNKFKETVESFIPPPQIGLLEALVFGDESQISQNWKDKLNLTGTRHIAAVSGMNITIIASLLLSFMLALGFWRGQAFYLTIILLILYILMIGAPASAVRAGIMGGILLLARHLGRQSSASLAVVFASTLMLAVNPLLLRLDVGFQLSFLAMLGLIYLQPIFFSWLKKIPDYKFFPVRTILSATLSAQIFTLPILIYNFGYFSLISIIPNILIVPFLAPITILIFIFGLGAMVFSWLGWLLSFPVFLALSYITETIDLFSKIPFAKISLQISWPWLVIAYLILSFIVWRLQESQKLKFLKY